MNALNLSCSALLFTAVLLFMQGCEKPEGYGGTSSISGKILTQYYYDDYSALVKVAPAADEDVFLMFGENENVADKVATGADGSFSFSFLRPGSYTVFYLSQDSTKTDFEKYVVNLHVELAAGEDNDLGTLNLLKTLDYDDGRATVGGVIRLINYKNSSQYPFLVVKDTSNAQDHEVFIKFKNRDYYEERIRTSYDGYFEFRNLIPGDYTVFTLSEDVTGATEHVVVSRDVTITAETDFTDLGELTIEQL